MEAVKASRATLESPLDPRTEERSRAGLHLPDSERDLFSLVRRLNIGLCEARRVEQVLDALRTGVSPAPPPMVEEPFSAAAEVPESELDASPDMRLMTEKKPRKPRKKPQEKAPEAPRPEEERSEDLEKEQVKERKEEEGKDQLETPAEKEEGEEDAAIGSGQKTARRSRKRESAPAPKGEPTDEPESQEGAEGETAGEAEELDDKKMEDISDSIKDIVSSIEKREVKREGGEERAEEKAKGRSGRTYCSVCHSIIATIHHGCGAHLCSRCVIDFNKDRRAEKNLCPKCLKPIETVPPAGGVKAGWRDTL
jgi:hypothetical protein